MTKNITDPDVTHQPVKTDDDKPIPQICNKRNWKISAFEKSENGQIQTYRNIFVSKLIESNVCNDCRRNMLQFPCESTLHHDQIKNNKLFSSGSSWALFFVLGFGNVFRVYAFPTSCWYSALNWAIHFRSWHRSVWKTPMAFCGVLWIDVSLSLLSRSTLSYAFGVCVLWRFISLVWRRHSCLQNYDSLEGKYDEEWPKRIYFFQCTSMCTLTMTPVMIAIRRDNGVMLRDVGGSPYELSNCAVWLGCDVFLFSAFCVVIIFEFEHWKLTFLWCVEEIRKI